VSAKEPSHPLVAVGLCLAALSPLVWNSSLHAALTLPKLAAAVAGLATCAVGLAATGGRGISAAVDAPLLACVAVLAASAQASLDPWYSWVGSYNSYACGAWPMAVAAALLACSCRGLDSPGRRSAVTWTVVVVASLVGLCAASQSLGWDPLPAGVSSVWEGRAYSTVGSPSSLGTLEAAVAPLALRLAVTSGGSRLIGAAALAAVLGGVLASGSRGAMLAAAAGCAAYLILAAKLRGLAATRGRILAAVAAVALVAAAAGYQLSRRSLTSRSDAQRVELARAAVTTWLDHPWLGSGPATFELGFRRHRSAGYQEISGPAQYEENSHCDLTQALATTGLLGLAAYLWLLATLAVSAAGALRDPGSRDEAASVAAGLLALLVAAKFSPVPIEVTVTAAVIAGILVRPVGFEGSKLATPIMILAAASVFLASSLISADSRFKKSREARSTGDSEAAATRLGEAIAGNPWEVTYSVAMVNALGEAAEVTPPGPWRTRLRAHAAQVARNAVIRHPNLSTAHYALGHALTEAARDGTGDISDGERELDAALTLDPHHAPLVAARKRAALVRKVLSASRDGRRT